jgi:peptide chain release factor 1
MPRARGSATAAQERLQQLLVPRDPADDQATRILEVKVGGGRRGVGAVRRRPPADVFCATPRRAAGSTEIIDATEVRPGRLQVRAPWPCRPRARPAPGEAPWALAEVRGWRAPRPARAGHRVARTHPHVSAAGVLVMPEAEEVEVSIDDERPAHRRLPLQSGPGASRCQHHRLGGPDHPPAQRASVVSPARTRSRNCRTRIQALRVLRARLLASWPMDEAAAAASDARKLAGPHGRPLRAHPHLQLPREPGLRPPHRLQGLQPRHRSSAANSSRCSSRAIQADLRPRASRRSGER